MSKKRAGYVIVSTSRVANEPIDIAHSDWLNIETKLGTRLTPKVRQQLLTAVNIYASSKKPQSDIEPLKELETLLSKLRKHINAARNNVWHKDHKAIAKEKIEMDRWNAKFSEDKYNFEADLSIVLERYFHGGQTQTEFKRPAAQLDRYLKGITVLIELFKTILAEEAQATSEHRLWFLWAALVLAIFENNGISVQHSTKKQLLNGPVEALSRLQKQLPHELQRRKTSGSFRKGAVIAWKVGNRVKPKQLLILLRRWATGDSRPRSLMGYEWRVPDTITRLSQISAQKKIRD